MKPTALDRYIFVQFSPYFLVSLIFFSSVFLTHQLLDITNFIVNYQIGIVPALLLLVYSMPFFLGYVIPISTMIAVLLAFLRMSGDNEIIAVKASGISVYRLLYPVIVFCLGAGLLTALVSIQVVPWGQKAFKTLAGTAIASSPAMGLQEQSFISNFENITLYVGGMDRKNNVLSGIFIEDRQTVNNSVTITAPSGNFIFDQDTKIFRLSLSNGIINQADLKEKTFQTTHFQKYAVNLNLKQTFPQIISQRKDEKEMTLAELRDYLKTGDKRQSLYLSAHMEFHRKFSIPFACIALGVLAVPLGLQNRNAGKSAGVGLALVFFLAYYLLLTAGEILGEKGALPPALGMWLPNVVMAGLAGYLVTIAANDRSLQNQLGKMYRGIIRKRRGASSGHVDTV